MADSTTYTRRAPYIEAAQENYIDLLTQQVGRAPGSTITDADGNVIGTVPTLAQLGPQVAGQNVLTQAAQQQAATQAGLGQLTFGAEGDVTGIGTGTGVAGYQPFLDQAQQYQTQAGTTLGGAAALSGPQAYQQFMSPYQQQVIDTTLAEFDTQTAQGVPQLAANAIQAGAFGGGREGVAQAQYASDAAAKRAALQAQLLGQGFTQANQLANQAFTQQSNLANQQMGLGDFSRNLASLQPSLAASSVQQLGAAGTGNLAYQQAQLDAAQQRNQLAYNEPLSRLNAFGSGIAAQVSGAPTTTTTTTLGGGSVGPLSQALSAGLSAYGLGSIFGGN
jgi:hypothetical protein|tara:strand:- start:186 stop:1187 length:1002 start_codon:yes stop_codon:yes gene_type:complete